MGGWGSGRGTRYADKADDMLSIDVARLNRWGVFKPGGIKAGEISWSRNDVKHSFINYRVTDDAFVLNYRVRTRGEDEWKSISDPVPWRWTDQPVGGRRRWFGCPGCQRRVRVLYGGAYFRCRTCHGVVYESQYERFRAPGVNAAMRTRERLGGNPGLLTPFPDRPKGMHRRTYERLQRADWDASEALEGVLSGLYDRVR